jgi:ubiquinone/menaquinone biosynthesis C-methylase UbiE
MGIDLTPEHIKYSRKKSRGISNLEFRQGNFQNLEFQDESFDLVFEIESVCHATDMEKALSETKRVLKRGGRFIAIDGFRSRDFDAYSDDVKLASRLCEVAMAVSIPWQIHEWLALCEKVGFAIESADDLSRAIMPNLGRFQFLARGFFKFPALSKLLIKTLPYYLVQNSIAGMLMPFTVGMKAQRYYKVGLARK